MKLFKLLPIFFIVAFISLFISSCDDSGVTTNNNVNFSFSNLQRLNKDVDGLYEAWVRYPSGGNNVYISCGKFNISTAGNTIVDPSDNETSLNLRYVPSGINTANGIFITIEPPGDADTLPSGAKILGGSVTVNDSNLTSNLSMTHAEVLGNVAQNFPSATARYILNTPTTFSDTSDYAKGIWFCDMSQNTLFVNLPVIPPTLDWIYEGWITYKPNSVSGTTGRFLDPYSADLDGAGPYKGQDNGYNKPGEDYILNPPQPFNNIALNNGQFAVMITLEPKIEHPTALANPFFLKLFSADIPTNIGYGQISDVLTNLSSHLPTASIKIQTK
jgi:hypothetical protein